MNNRDDFLRTIRWQMPAGRCYGFGPLAMVREPGARYYDGQMRDFWGVTWGKGTGDVSNRLCVLPGHDVVTDVTQWETQLKLPDLSSPIFNFEQAGQQADAIDRRTQIVCLASTGGVFERTHFLMGFENCLTQMLMEPEAVGSLMDAVADFKIRLLTESYRRIRYEAVFFHDDWGAKTNLFFSPALWRALIRPREKRIVDAVKALGDVIFIHHSDSYLEPLVGDMAELGIDVWQGCIPQNDIAGLQKKYAGQIAFMGGIDIARIDRPDCGEEEIRREARRAFREYVPLGGILPGVPSGTALYPEVQRIVDDELASCVRNYEAHNVREEQNV